MIRIENISKQFKKLQALDQVICCSLIAEK